MSQQNQYIVSARKYRPATFQTVVGQKALTATLKNAILGGKLAQAYLFCGPRGVGKTSCARIFAKTINCMHPTADGEACGECESCRAIEKGNSFNLVELDAASNNSVDDIRKITDQVNIPAQDGRYRVFIIDEVHMLSNSAFNAFLKTLEEPPKNVVFILATTERHKVIPTIMSRCQVYDFRRITVNDIIDHLQYVAQKEGVNTKREALGVIAQQADGAMRDALSIFDQVVASTNGNLTYEGTIDALNVLDQEYYFRLIDTFRNGDVPQALLTFKEITDKGFDAQFFVNGLADHIRNLMVCADPRTMSLLETSEELAKKYSVQAPQLPVEWYYDAMRILNDTDFKYRTSSNKRLLVELAMIRLSRLLNSPQVNLQPSPQVSPQSSPQMAPGVTSSHSQTPKSPIGKSSSNPVHPFVTPDGNKPQPDPGSDTEAQKENRSVTTTGAKKLHDDTRRGNPGRFQSFRLSDIASQEKNMSDVPRNQSFTPEKFKEVWEGYANMHPDQRILVGAMHSAEPERISDLEYKVTVDHPAQKQAFESSLPDMLEYFKRELQNDGVTLSVVVSEKDSKEKTLNTREFLKLAVDENPELAKFLKAVDAELD